MSVALKGELVTISTQTEWSWLQDLIAVGRTAASPFDHSTLDQWASSEVSDVHLVPKKGRKGHTVVNEGDGEIENENDAENGKGDAEEKEGHYDMSIEDEAIVNNVGDIQNSDTNGLSSEKEEHQYQPQAAVIGSFKDSIDKYSSSYSDSDSELSSIDSHYEGETPFPSVGLPQMLEVMRETTSNKITVDLKEAAKSNVNPEKAFYKSFFSGPCQFCGGRVLPLPTVREIKTIHSSKLFCCGQYEEFVKLYITYDRKKNSEKEVIDIKPHAPYGSKAARRAAKERAAERMREKEIEKQKAATAQANFFSFTRQVKTVQYALSSQKCIQDGWTIMPKATQVEPVKAESQEFSVEVNTSLLQKKYELYEKYYDNGNRFIVIFPDGTGCCYYPSGNVAVVITSYEAGKYQYLLQKDSDDYDTDDPGILGSFDPSGKACCYFKDGSLRLVLNPHYGVQLDKHGNYKKRWSWHFVKGHVHTPPFQPICFALNKQMSCRVMEQDHIVITFTSDQRTVRFNVGAKLKAIKHSMPTSSKQNEHEQFMESIKKRIQTIQGKIHLMMKFPNSPKLDVLVSQKERENTLESSQRKAFQLPKLKGKDPSVVVN